MIGVPEDDPRVRVRTLHVARASNGSASEGGYEADALGVEQPARPLATVTVASFASREVRPRPWLVRDMIPDLTVTLLSGDGGTGKSLVAQQLAVAVAAARDWLGTMPEPGGVMYVSAEDDLDEVHRRVVDITEAANVGLGDLRDFHLVPMAGKDAVLAMPNKGDIISPTPLWDSLVATVKAIGPRLLVLDNLADVFAGNENSRPQARQFIGMLRGLAIEHRLAVLIISHPSLTGLSSGTGTSGSTAWSNSVRSRMYLERAKVDDGDEPDPDLRIMRVMKANYAPVGAEVRMRWQHGTFRLETGGVGAFDRMAADSQAERVFLELLREYRRQDRDVSEKPSPNYAPAVFAKHPDGKAISKRAFVNAMNQLFRVGTIQVETAGPPSRQRRRIVVTE